MKFLLVVSYKYKPTIKCKRCNNISLIPYDHRENGSYLLCCEVCGKHHFFDNFRGLIMIDNAGERIEKSNYKNNRISQKT